MNKAMKSLSAVLALTIGVATAGLVFAQDYAEPLGEGALALLVGKEDAKEAAKKDSIFYSPKLVVEKYAETVKQLDEEYKAFAKDVNRKAHIETVACNTKVAIEELDKEIAVADKLVELGKGAAKLGEKKYKTLAATEEALGEEVTIAAETVFSAKDLAEVKKLLKTYEQLQAEDLTKKLSEVDGITKVYKTKKAETLAKTVKALDALMEKVNDENYQTLVKHAMTHYGTAESANLRFLVELKAQRDIAAGQVNALYVLGEQLGVKFDSKCLVPGGVPATPADAAADQAKDNVPSTAAHR